VGSPDQIPYSVEHRLLESAMSIANGEEGKEITEFNQKTLQQVNKI